MLALLLSLPMTQPSTLSRQPALRPEEHRAAPLATELWFGAHETAELMSQPATTTVRLGDRSSTTVDTKGGYRIGGIITARLQRPDKTLDDSSAPFVVAEVRTVPFGSLTDADLIDSLPSQRTVSSLERALHGYYGRAIRADELVTVVRIEKVESLHSVDDLIRTRMISPATLPAENPSSLAFPTYTIPLIAEDYPAKTAIMWNAAYRAYDLPHGNVMSVADPETAKTILDVFRRDPRYRGGGAGVGFKDTAVKHLDVLDDSAAQVGAVNFIRATEDRQLVGYNTDGVGYARSLRALFDVRGEQLHGKKVVMLGAGGTGNAVAFALAQEGVRLVILNRTVEKAVQLAASISERSRSGTTPDVRAGGEDQIASEVLDADVILNVSTKGAVGTMEHFSALAPASLPATPESIQQNHEESARILTRIRSTTIVSDIVLTKGGTPLLRAAEEAGFTTLDGIPMVVEQAVEAFWILHSDELTERGITKEMLAVTMRQAASR